MKHKYKYGILAAALASALFGAPSWAQTTSTSTSGSNANGTGIGIGGGNANSNSRSGSYSGSSSIGSLGTGGSASANGGTGGAAGSIVNFTYNDPAAPADPTENLITSGTQRIITTGAAIAPSIYSNNVCALSASAAGGFLGGAFALGFDRVDKGCDRRAWASLLGHYAEIYSIAAAHAPDMATRQLALQEAAIYAQWANNYMCMQNEELAAAAPPDAHFCHTVATQAGLQVVPAPVAYTMPPKQVAVVANPPATLADPPRPLVAVADPPPKPRYDGPHIYGDHEGGVPTSYHTGPISGYNGPDYTDDDGKMRD